MSAAAVHGDIDRDGNVVDEALLARIGVAVERVWRPPPGIDVRLLEAARDAAQAAAVRRMLEARRCR